MWDASVAMRDIMNDLGNAVDAGKDSFSMASRYPAGDDATELHRVTSTLVITSYCTAPDIHSKLMSDLKQPDGSMLLHVDVAKGKRRMGGNELAQVYGQAGYVLPDVDGPRILRQGSIFWKRCTVDIHRLPFESRLLALARATKTPPCHARHRSHSSTAVSAPCTEAASQVHTKLTPLDVFLLSSLLPLGFSFGQLPDRMYLQTDFNGRASVPFARRAKK